MSTTRRYWLKGISLVVIFYLIFNLSSPLFLDRDKQLKNIETPDLILIALVLLFNSELLNKLENISFSKDGSFKAEFKQLKESQEKLEETQKQQKKQIEETQEQQKVQISNVNKEISGLHEAIKHFNSREDILRREPDAINKNLALVGLKVRSGDVIDAITPIYAVITPDFTLGKQVDGVQYGGMGGGETPLVRDGCIVTGVNLYRGDYFGREEIIHIELIWQKLTQKGIDSEEVFSPKLGSGNYAKDIILEELRTESDCYIYNFSCKTSDHTSGETFLHDFTIDAKKLPTL
ncbi:MAG: hypothetical protein J7647_19540 [Cyanobacteria bacterium SBLK]|nr:hypothetical protein [Cyanobacteria bacterium SBLK]